MPYEKAVDVSHLTVHYGEHSVLWDINLSLPSSKLIALIGPNGAGKSTLLKALLGLIKPACGTVLFFGKPFHLCDRSISYTPQKESIDWDFPITLFDLVLMGRFGKMGLFKRPSKLDLAKAEEALVCVGLQDLRHRQINQLSGGQKQRAFLARALAQEADLYFLDEPFANVDLTSMEIMIEKLFQLKQEGKTVIVVHHDLESVPALFDWVVLLNVGLIAAGEVATTLTSELLKKTFGKEHKLFEEALTLTRKKQGGYS